MGSTFYLLNSWLPNVLSVCRAATKSSSTTCYDISGYLIKLGGPNLAKQACCNKLETNLHENIKK